MNEVLHNPPYAPSWIVREAQANRIDGAVILMPRAAALGQRQRFIAAALEKAGIPHHDGRVRHGRWPWLERRGRARGHGPLHRGAPVNRALDILMVGDIIPDEPNPARCSTQPRHAHRR